MNRLLLLMSVTGLLWTTSACAPAESSKAPVVPQGAALASAQVEAPKAATPRTYIVSPIDGATVPTTFKVVFGLDGLGVAPAGTVREGTGHHHLLIDLEELPDMTRPLPATDKIVHFGGGQTETEVTLSPGTHTLQLLLGDYAHIPLGESMLSSKITVTVK